MSAATSAYRPHVLWLGTDLPWPLDSGFRIRAFENLAALAEFCDVTAVCLAEPPDVGRRARELAAALPSVRVEPPVEHRIHIRRDPVRLAGAFASGLANGLPYKVAKFRSAEMDAALERLLPGCWVDVVHVEVATAVYVDRVAVLADGPCHVVLDEHNVESELLAEHCASRSFGALTPVARLEASRLRTFERDCADRASAVFLISDEDRASLARLSPGAARSMCVVPPVVGSAVLESEARRGRSNGRARSDAQVALFVGQMSWMPNEEAMAWFAEAIAPRLAELRPDLRVQVVGGGASAATRERLQAAGIEVLGYVEDLGAVYEDATVFLAPFLTGGGVRIKLLDAMAAGIPIVTTRAGAKGLDASAGAAMLVADAPGDFAAAVARVASDPELAARMQVAGREFVHRHHSRAAAVATMRDAYTRLLGLGVEARPRLEAS